MYTYTCMGIMGDDNSLFWGFYLRMPKDASIDLSYCQIQYSDPSSMAMTQEPTKIEVPTIFKAYFSGLCFRGYPHKIWPKNSTLTVILKFPLITVWVGIYFFNLAGWGFGIWYTCFIFCPQSCQSIDWFKGKNTGKSNCSWENLCFPVIFPLNQPIDSIMSMDYAWFSSDNRKVKFRSKFQEMVMLSRWFSRAKTASGKRWQFANWKSQSLPSGILT